MKHVVLCLLVMAFARAASADFTWFNNSTSRVTYASGGTNYIRGDKTNATIGCFVQLIYAGANATNDSAVDSGTGVSGDDVVASNFWMGVNFGGEDGFTVDGIFADDVLGFYFVRVWTAPAFNFTNGLVPLSPTNFYGDSALFSNACPGCSGPFATNWNFGLPLFSTTLKAQETDTDGDGLPDWWEMQNFGNPTNTLPNDDFDGDGTVNNTEYVAGTQPTNDLSVFALTTVTSATSSVIIHWSSVDTKTYSVQRATNVLSDYETVSSNIPALPPINTYTDAAGTIYFYRIGVR